MKAEQRQISVLHIVISLETGGLEKFVLDLVRATSPSFRHSIVCLERPGELLLATDILDITCLYLQPGVRIDAVLELRKIVKEKQVDVIHTHNQKALFYGAWAGFCSRTPVIHTKHGKNKITFKSVVKNNLLSHLCEKIVAVSSDAALQCQKEERISARKVMTVLNGIDTHRFCPGKDVTDLKASLGLDPCIPVIGIVARLAEVKNHASLLNACEIIKKAGIEFRLLIVGDGPLMGPLVRHAKELGLSKKVVFTGMRDDVPDLMNAMDIFVLSSLSEGISLTLLEAMACELPVVATRVGGNPEVVVHGQTGLLVKSGEPEELAARIMALLQSPELRQQFGRNGRLRTCQQFGIKKAATAYESLYSAALGVQ